MKNNQPIKIHSEVSFFEGGSEQSIRLLRVLRGGVHSEGLMA